MLTVVTAISNTTKKIEENIGQSVDKAMENISKYMPKMDARLQGTGKDYAALSAMVRQNLAVSPFVKQTEVLESLSKLVSAGIVRNLEQRAFLDSVSDKISETFNALNSTLTRLVRLQQYDTTAARLGMREGLTEFFNTQFMDSSYLNDMYDTVSGAIIEANSLLSRDESVAFEYAVQKWLGSLYALGVSQEAVGNIAQGLSYISTGNINALNSNQGMQTLFAMATENAGMSYSSMLTQGLDAEMVDTLMLSMVNYLGEIAKNTSNQVVKSQWADILNMTVSDLRAVSNLTEADMAAISSQSNLNFSQSRSSVASFLGSNEFFNRYSSQELVANILENALFGKGMAISLDPTASTQYLLQSFHESLMGNGSIIEKFGIWLENTMRAASVDALSELDYIEPILTAAMFGGKATFNEWSDKLFDQFSLSHAFDAGNYTDKWWLNGLITNATGGLAQLYNLAFGGVIPDAINNAYMYNTTTSDIRNRAFGNQIGMLNLENWGATVYNQNRGADFTGLTTAGVGALGDLIWAMSDNTPFRTSVSRSATVYTSAADSITKGFDAVESSANVISSASEETTDQMEKLYNMLFESQSVPIKVFIEGYSDDFKENSEELLGKINDELADRLEIALNNSSNSVYSMISTIQGLKGV